MSQPDVFYSSSSNSGVRQAFDDDGFVVMKEIIPQPILQDWQIFADKYWKEVFELLYQNGHTSFPTYYRVGDDGLREYALGRGIKNGFRDVVMRSPGRFELSLLHPSSEHHPPLEPLMEQLNEMMVPQLLNATSWKDLKISNLSLIVATPGSTEQSWHADGGHMSVSKHLPCHCMNIFIPLVAITMENGPTEIRPGTHYHTRNLAKMMLAAKARKTLRPPMAPMLSLSDALLFDYRVLHRGLANVCVDEKELRTILCLTVAQPWFKDILNFPQRSITTACQASDGGEDNKDIEALDR
jgi:hypothetical protein